MNKRDRHRVQVRSVVIVAVLLVAGIQNVNAQCKPGDILVGEDEDNYYCKPRAEFAACISAAGRQLRNAKPRCAVEVEQCFRGKGYVLTGAGLACVLGCLASVLNPARCTAACGVAGVAATQVLEECGVDKANTCFGDALIAHRDAVDECKR